MISVLGLAGQPSHRPRRDSAPAVRIEFSRLTAAKVAFSMSRDGGFTWSSPIRIDQSVGNSQAFRPVVHAASDGTVGVTYYDFENATAARPGMTDTFIVHCHAATSDCTNPVS